MKKMNKNIEEITFSQIKKLGADSPSADFTNKVMQSILAENQEVNVPAPKRYFWLFVLVPLMVILCWYFLVLFNLNVLVVQYLSSITNSSNTFFNSFLNISNQLKNFSIQSTILISFVAIISLLILEELLSKWKYST
jgi:hypothetical protein